MKKTLNQIMLRRIGLGITGLVALLVLAVSVVDAQVGPNSPGGVGSGAIGTDSSRNIAIGSTTTDSTTKLTVTASSTASSAYAIQVKQPNGTVIFYVRNDGAVSIPGTLTAGSFSTTISATNVSAGAFGANTGGGNYYFPASLGVGVSPSYRLHVQASGGGQLRFTEAFGDAELTIMSSAGNMYPKLYVRYNNGTSAGYYSGNDLGLYMYAVEGFSLVTQHSSTTSDRMRVDSSGGVRFMLSPGNQFSVGTAATNASGLLNVYRAGSTGDGFVDLGGGSNPVLRVDSATNEVTIYGKLNASTIDPIYEIGGEKFATYMAGMIGVKEEVAGSLTIPCSDGRCERTIVFATEPHGTDLWLFGKVSDISKHLDQASILLTPAFDGSVRYAKGDGALTITATPASPQENVEVSFRFTAPRFDTDKWTNRTDSKSRGFVID